jgi:hypothetical protein
MDFNIQYFVYFSQYQLHGIKEMKQWIVVCFSSFTDKWLGCNFHHTSCYVIEGFNTFYVLILSLNF